VAKPHARAGLSIDVAQAMDVLHGTRDGDQRCWHAIDTRFTQKGWNPSLLDVARTHELPSDAPAGYRERGTTFRANATRYPALVEELAAASTDLESEAYGVVQSFLPGAPATAFHVCLALLAPSDAFVVDDVNGAPVLTIDLTGAAEQDRSAQRVSLRAALWHELWHASFHTIVEQRWQRSPESEVDPARRLAFDLVNEGFGHYLSFIAYSGSTETLSEGTVATIEAHAAALAPTTHARIEAVLASSPNDPGLAALLESSSTGDTLAKWGVVPMMSLLHRAIERFGRGQVIASLSSGLDATFALLFAVDSGQIFSAQFRTHLAHTTP
jgi:hypothetical protein